MDDVLSKRFNKNNEFFKNDNLMWWLVVVSGGYYGVMPHCRHLVTLPVD